CVFVAGTDTDAGKTVAAVALLQALQQRGLRCLASKPIAAGAEQTEHGLRNSDALYLQQAAGGLQAYEQVNPYCFAAPIAPHIAAEQQGHRLQGSAIAASLRQLQAQPADYRVIEGAGGWLLPLNAHETLADVITELHIPVLLVIVLTQLCRYRFLLPVSQLQLLSLPIVCQIANQPQPLAILYQVEFIATL